MTKKRATMMVELDASAKAWLDQWHELSGVPKKRIVSRIIKWLASRVDLHEEVLGAPPRQEAPLASRRPMG